MVSAPVARELCENANEPEMNAKYSTEEIISAECGTARALVRSAERVADYPVAKSGRTVASESGHSYFLSL